CGARFPQFAVREYPGLARGCAAPPLSPDVPLAHAGLRGNLLAGGRRGSPHKEQRSMYFQFACDQCGKKLKVRDELAGRRVRCPYCQNTISVPTQSPEPELPPLTAAFPGLGGAPAFGQAPAAPQTTAKSGAAAKGSSSSTNEQNDGT